MKSNFKVKMEFLNLLDQQALLFKYLRHFNYIINGLVVFFLLPPLDLYQVLSNQLQRKC